MWFGRSTRTGVRVLKCRDGSLPLARGETNHAPWARAGRVRPCWEDAWCMLCVVPVSAHTRGTGVVERRTPSTRPRPSAQRDVQRLVCCCAKDISQRGGHRATKNPGCGASAGVPGSHITFTGVQRRSVSETVSGAQLRSVTGVQLHFVPDGHEVLDEAHRASRTARLWRVAWSTSQTLHGLLRVLQARRAAQHLAADAPGVSGPQSAYQHL